MNRSLSNVVNMKTAYRIVWLDVGCLWSALVLGLVVLAPVRAQQGAPHVFLQDALRELSTRTGDVFALEFFAKTREVPWSQYVPMDVAVMNAYTSPEKLLGAYFPQFRVKRSASWPNLYFISNLEVVNIPDYAMSRRLSKFEVDGPPWQLIARLHDLVPSITEAKSFWIPDLNRAGPSLFHTAPVRVSLESVDVRHVLSGVVDLKKTRGIAWVAITRLKDERQETTVAYTQDTVFLKSENHDTKKEMNGKK